MNNSISSKKRIKNYSIGLKLGNNNFSTNFQALNRVTNQKYLVKEFKKEFIDSDEKIKNYLKKEISFIIECNRKSEIILKILDTSMTMQNYYIFV